MPDVGVDDRKTVDRVKRADEAAAEARQALRQLMRGEIAAGRTTKSQIARDLGVSRQRIQKMLED
jgi:DNA-binding phage protein